MEALHAKGALCNAERLFEQANLHCQSAFIMLRLLVASVRSLHENLDLAAEGNFDFDLIKVTDGEIDDRANELIRRLHADNI